MKTRRIAVLAVFGLSLTFGLAFAHHGTSGYYDANKVAKVEGIVKEFVWRNPHCGLFVVAKNAAGKEVTYALEMGSPSSMARRGFTRNHIKPGDKVIASFHPAFTNPAAGEVASGELFVNGKPFIQERSSPTRNITNE